MVSTRSCATWPPPARTGGQRWLLELLTLWMMDTINIITTYASAPSSFPLPAQGLAFLEKPSSVLVVAERASWALANRRKPPLVWEHALQDLVREVS